MLTTKSTIYTIDEKQIQLVGYIQQKKNKWYYLLIKAWFSMSKSAFFRQKKGLYMLQSPFSMKVIS